MRAETRRDRPAPLPQGCRLDLPRESRAEVASDQVLRSLLDPTWQHGRLTQFPRLGASRHRNARRSNCALDIRRSPLVVEEDLLEAHRRRQEEAAGVLGHVGPEVRIGWLFACTLLFHNDLELLANTPLYQRVVAIETERQPLPIENLVAHVGVDESRELLVARLPDPARFVLARYLVDHRLADHDARASPIRRCNLSIHDEERDADQQKVKNRLLKQSFCSHAIPLVVKEIRAQPIGYVDHCGEYQIGDVYARSWIAVGAAAG